MIRDKRYDLLASVYDCSMRVVERGLAPHRRELLVRARGRVLDIGIGSGATLEYYEKSCQVTGIDTSTAMLPRAARKAAALGIDFRGAVMDAGRLAFPDDSFDTVVSSLVICSVASPERTLCEVRRVIRPGGKALFIEHVRPSGALGVVVDVRSFSKARERRWPGTTTLPPRRGQNQE